MKQLSGKGDGGAVSTTANDRIVATYPALAEYRAHLDQRARAEGVDTDSLWYPTYHWHAWCDAHGVHPLRPLTSDLDSYINGPRVDGQPAASSTRAHRRVALIHFYDRVLINTPDPPPNPARAIKPPLVSPATKTRLLSPLQVAALERAVDTGPPTRERARNRVIIRLLTTHGLRPKSIRTARREDVQLDDPDRPLLFVRPIKRGPGVTHVLDPAIADLLTHWLRISPARHRFAPLLPNSYGGEMSNTSIGRIVRAVAARAGIPDPETVSPRVLRASVGAHAARGNAPIHTIQRHFGHRSAATTGRYLESVDPDLSALPYIKAYREQWIKENAVEAPARR